jgi:hypothetical protein
LKVAEKRAALSAAGEAWPDCDCHDEPLSWSSDPKMRVGGAWRCAVTHRAEVAARRARRLAEGVCSRCQGPLATETMCRPCADYYADQMAKPENRIAHRKADSRFRQNRRSQEGFRPTGAGRAAFAAWTEERT